MKIRTLTYLFILLSAAAGVSAQTSWLDRPLRNWNTSGTVPRAPRTDADSAMQAQCRMTIRTPDSVADRAVTQRGWSLFGASQSYGNISLVKALAGFDGMCRPTQYNVFVFVGSRFAGTLAPEPMDARTDGSLRDATLWDRGNITAEFNRYSANDPLCCPSQKSSVIYDLPATAAGRVTATDVTTSAVCETGQPTEENIVTGTVTYRNRSALPAGAVIRVKLVDVSRADASGTVIAEQQIDANGKQVPFEFSIEFKPGQINERNRYNIQAEIRQNNRLLYISDVAYPVLTQGNPKNAEIVVVPVRGGQNPGTGTPNRRIRGSVTYLQRIALPADSTVRVRLIETNAANSETDVIAETGVETGTRQVPIDFELPYAQSSVQNGRTYALEAEILTNNEIMFKTAEPHRLSVTGANISNVRLTLVQAETAITGKSISLSKFGTGSLKIGDQSSQFIIRGNVNVTTDGDAEVSVGALSGTTTFSGKVIEFSDDVIRIRVTNSGNADASGEIEVRYSGRSLRSIIGNDLVLDSQETTLRF